MQNTARIGVLLMAMGCLEDPDPMGQFGEEEQIRCEETSRTAVLPDDIVEVGYLDALQQVGVSDMLAQAGGTFTETMEWSDGTESEVTVTLSDAAGAERVTYEDGGGATESEPVPNACPTQLEFTVSAVLTTSDGRMDDAFVGVVRSLGDNVHVEHRVTSPGGSIDIEALAQVGVDVEPDEVRVSMRVSDGSTPFSGSLLPQPIGGFDDDAQSLGTWPAGAFEDG